MFEYLVTFLNVVGVVTNSFIIAFTSKWADNTLNSTENKLSCVVIFQVKLKSLRFFLSNNFFL